MTYAQEKINTLFAKIAEALESSPRDPVRAGRLLTELKTEVTAALAARQPSVGEV